jgi:sulfur dioxygenase
MSKANIIFRQLFDKETSTFTYLIADAETKEAVIIDSVLENFDRDVKLIEELGLDLKYSLETHIHADHVTAAAKFKEKLGVETAVNENAKVDCASIFLKDQQELKFGNLILKAFYTPGHTDTCMSYLVNDMLFTGDCLFIRGTGRTDFQNGDSQEMFNSIRNIIFNLPDETKIYPGHDYKGMSESRVSEEKEFNPRINLSVDKKQFVEIMANLDLSQPKNIHVAVPANLECGRR